MKKSQAIAAAATSPTPSPSTSSSQVIDSKSVGDPNRFCTLAQLEEGLRALPDAPKINGRVVLLVRRSDGGRRELPERVRLEMDGGFPGDSWTRRTERNLEAQLTVNQWDVAKLIAHGQPLPLFGDNLTLELDISETNLPIGSRLKVGSAILEVTPLPHNGCRKFATRFGEEARAFVCKPELRHRNLRGIHMRIVAAGEIALNDPVVVLAQAAQASRVPV